MQGSRPRTASVFPGTCMPAIQSATGQPRTLRRREVQDADAYMAAVKKRIEAEPDLDRRKLLAAAELSKHETREAKAVIAAERARRAAERQAIKDADGEAYLARKADIGQGEAERRRADTMPPIPLEIAAATVIGDMSPSVYALSIEAIARAPNRRKGTLFTQDGLYEIPFSAIDFDQDLDVEKGTAHQWIRRALNKARQQWPAVLIRLNDGTETPLIESMELFRPDDGGRALRFRLPPAVQALVARTQDGKLSQDYCRIKPPVLAGMKSISSQRLYLWATHYRGRTFRTWQVTPEALCERLSLPPGSAACDIELVLDRAIAEMPSETTMMLVWSPLKTSRQRIRRYEFEVISRHCDLREVVAAARQKMVPREDPGAVFRSLRHQVKRYWRNLKRAKSADAYFARYAAGTPAEFLGRAKFEGRLPRVAEHVEMYGTVDRGGKIVPRNVIDAREAARAI
jgi:hypothetical protein